MHRLLCTVGRMALYFDGRSPTFICAVPQKHGCCCHYFKLSTVRLRRSDPGYCTLREVREIYLQTRVPAYTGHGQTATHNYRESLYRLLQLSMSAVRAIGGASPFFHLTTPRLLPFEETCSHRNKNRLIPSFIPVREGNALFIIASIIPLSYSRSLRSKSCWKIVSSSLDGSDGKRDPSPSEGDGGDVDIEISCRRRGAVITTGADTLTPENFGLGGGISVSTCTVVSLVQGFDGVLPVVLLLFPSFIGPASCGRVARVKKYSSVLLQSLLYAFHSGRGRDPWSGGCLSAAWWARERRVSILRQSCPKRCRACTVCTKPSLILSINSIPRAAISLSAV